MNLDQLRLDCAIKQKKGLHFILASVLIWFAILLIHLTSFPILTKNLLTFCASAPLMPISFIISKIIKVDFQNKENQLSGLGLLFSLNQILYLLIAMWIYRVVPDKMVMIIAMIFGAHLLPYSWLYKSKSYMLFSILISILAFIIGILYKPFILASIMIIIEIIFSACLIVENIKMKRRLM